MTRITLIFLASACLFAGDPAPVAAQPAPVAKQITFDRDLFQTRMRILENLRAAKRALAYMRCVRENGGDWTHPGCLGIERIPQINRPEPGVLALIDRLPEGDADWVSLQLEQAELVDFRALFQELAELQAEFENP